MQKLRNNTMENQAATPITPKKRKKTVDAVAASLILEGYLTFKKFH